MKCSKCGQPIIWPQPFAGHLAKVWHMYCPDAEEDDYDIAIPESTGGD